MILLGVSEMEVGLDVVVSGVGEGLQRDDPYSFFLASSFLPI